MVRLLRRLAAGLESQLALFPEVKQAENHVSAGRFDLAEPLLCRTVTVCASLPGAGALADEARRRLLSVYHATNNPAALPLHSHLQQRGVQALRRSPSDDATIECVNDILSASEFFGRHGWGARAVEAVDEVSAAPLLARLPPELLIDVGVTAYAAYASATLVGVEGLVGGKAHVRESALAASAALPSLPVPSAALWCNIAALPHISSGALSFHDPLLNSSSGSSAVKGGVSNSLCEEAREGYARALAALVGCSDPNALLLRSHIASNAVDVAWAQLGQDSVVEQLRDSLKYAEAVPPIGKWVLSRPLTSMARIHLDSSQAVTSEGLFRAAVAAFASPASGKSCLPASKASKLDHLGPTEREYLKSSMRWYARLLEQWERREEEAAAMMAEAKAILPVPGSSDAVVNAISAFVCSVTR